MSIEEHNLSEIAGLSQRGQTLSVVDLIKANTLSAEMAARSLYTIANGASFLTAARPGNAGKTTLLACLLTFLPPGIKIVTTSSSSVVTNSHSLMKEEKPENLCFLCHEIGSGHWFGYLWGQYVGKLFHLMSEGCRIASCIHADTLPEMRDILTSDELGVSQDDFAQLGLILFMNLERRRDGYRRRVSAMYESPQDGGQHRLLYKWDRDSDTFRAMPSDRAPKLEHYKSFINALLGSGNTDFRWVRQQVLNFYAQDKIWT